MPNTGESEDTILADEDLKTAIKSLTKIAERLPIPPSEAKKQVYEDYNRLIKSGRAGESDPVEQLRRSYLAQIFNKLCDDHRDYLINLIIVQATAYPGGVELALNDPPDAILSNAVRLAIEEPEDFKNPKARWNPDKKSAEEHLQWLIERAVSGSCVRKALGALAAQVEDYSQFERKLRSFAAWRARWLVEYGKTTVDDQVNEALTDALEGYLLWNPKKELIKFVNGIVSSHCDHLEEAILGKRRGKRRFRRLMDIPLRAREELLRGMAETDREEFLRDMTPKERQQLVTLQSRRHGVVHVGFDEFPIAVKGAGPEETLIRKEARQRLNRWYEAVSDLFATGSSERAILRAWKDDPDIKRHHFENILGSVDEYDKAIARLKYAVETAQAKEIKRLLELCAKVDGLIELDDDVTKLVSAWEADPNLQHEAMVKLFDSPDAFKKAVSSLHSTVRKVLGNKKLCITLFGDDVAEALSDLSEELSLVPDETAWEVVCLLNECAGADDDEVSADGEGEGEE